MDDYRGARAVVGAAVTMTYYSCSVCKGQPTRTRTDAEGAFAFVDLPANTTEGSSYTFDVQALFYSRYTKTNDVFEPDETYLVWISLDPAPQIWDELPARK